MRFAIRHEMTYSYESPVRQSTQYVRLSPRDTARQRVLGWKVETARPAMRTDDGYGNVLHVLTLDKPVAEIAIRASGSVETSPGDGPSDFLGVPLSPLLFLRMTPLTRPESQLAQRRPGACFHRRLPHARRAGALCLGLRVRASRRG
jgi:transglutaminase-like putative cysteine protease